MQDVDLMTIDSFGGMLMDVACIAMGYEAVNIDQQHQPTSHAGPTTPAELHAVPNFCCTIICSNVQDHPSAAKLANIMEMAVHMQAPTIHAPPSASSPLYLLAGSHLLLIKLH